MLSRSLAAAAVILAALALAGCSTAPARAWSQDDYLKRLHAEGLTQVTASNVDHFSTENCRTLRDDVKVSPSKGALTSVLAIGIAMNLRDTVAAQKVLETVTEQYCPDMTTAVEAALDGPTTLNNS